ncbi:hypothetical protein GCM10027049_06920 [Mucilaginibacter puniceus]
MKSIFIVFIICLVVYQVNAQNDPKAKAFINEIIIAQDIADSISVSEMLVRYNLPKDPRPKVRRVYQDVVGEGITYLREAMQANKNGIVYGRSTDSLIYIDNAGNKSRVSRQDTYKMHPLPLKARFEPILADSMKITAEERAYINAEIEKMQKHTWQERLVLDAQLITADSVKKVFDKSKTDKMFDGWTYFSNKGVDRIYNFSVPIFFRNDTYCLFYCGYGCGWLCGSGTVTVYKKVNGKWEPFSTLASWIS